jgi:lipopolysaccharide transport system ATP-binding protein
MSQPVIVAEGLGKKYNLRHNAVNNEGFRHLLERSLYAPFRWLRPRTAVPAPVAEEDQEHEEFWALRDVSFNVEPGEVVGVIGRNGAGKSTLLKILSRITEPSRGRVRIRGRVASLLEVGTGFHHELSGRENIYLNGTILGMTRREIKAKFDEIVDFAEVEKFLDTPVKHYSSGMYVRLAFAVAAYLEPEILIIDEVLAVGDAQFQKKCLGKMQDVSQREGRTVLFVSHNMAAVSTLTKRVILLKQGRVDYIGDAREGINLYMSAGSEDDSVYVKKAAGKDPGITRVEIACSEGSKTHASGKPWRVKFHVYAPSPSPNACLRFNIVNQYQQAVLQLCAYDQPDFKICRETGTTVVECEIPQLDLNIGSYFLTVKMNDPASGSDVEVLPHVCPFEVVILGRTTRFGWHSRDATFLVPGSWSLK